VKEQKISSKAEEISHFTKKSGDKENQEIS
jgi:hypothetical protein